MKKIFTFLALAMFCVMSHAQSIGAPASMDFGSYVLTSSGVTDSLDININPSGISSWGIGVEIVDDTEGVFWVSDSWLYEDGTLYGGEKAKVYFLAIEEGTFTATLRLSDYNSTYDDITELYAVHEDVALSVKITSAAEGIEDVESGVEVRKVVRDGRILIIRNGETYTLTGVRVK